MFPVSEDVWSKQADSFKNSPTPSPSEFVTLYSSRYRIQRIRLQFLAVRDSCWPCLEFSKLRKTLHTGHVRDPLPSGLQLLLDYPIIRVYCGALNGTKQTSSSADACGESANRTSASAVVPIICRSERCRSRQSGFKSLRGGSKMRDVDTATLSRSEALKGISCFVRKKCCH